MNKTKATALVTPDTAVGMVCPVHGDLKPQDAAHVAMIAPEDGCTRLDAEGSPAEAQREQDGTGRGTPGLFGNPTPARGRVTSQQSPSSKIN